MKRLFHRPTAFAAAAVTILLAAAVVSPSTARGDGPWTETIELFASNGLSGEGFGVSVTLVGDTALVGTAGDDQNGEDAGAVYVFDRSAGAWAEESKLIAGDGTANDLFGVSVSLSGDTALIGASQDSDQGDFQGSAYVLERTEAGWAEEAKLYLPGGIDFGLFGSSTALSGDHALVGSIAGVVTYFAKGGGSWPAVDFVLPDDSPISSFGSALAMDGDLALIGAWADDTNGAAAGSAYIFERSGTSWTQQQKLYPGDAAAGMTFGISVALVGDTALVGAYSDATNGADSGSAYVFVKSGAEWIEQEKLVPDDPDEGDRFGISVALSEDVALVGARHDEDNGTSSGSAYVFRRSGDTWSQEAKLLASDGVVGDFFGGSVALSSETALIGATHASGAEFDTGSAYVFDGPLLFQDGFESGDTTAWSVVVP